MKCVNLVKAGPMHDSTRSKDAQVICKCMHKVQEIKEHRCLNTVLGMTQPKYNRIPSMYLKSYIVQNRTGPVVRPLNSPCISVVGTKRP